MPIGHRWTGGAAGFRVLTGRLNPGPAPEPVPDPQQDGEAAEPGGLSVAWRQDEHGNRYDVARHDNQTAARRQTDEPQARRHKQTYRMARWA